MVVEELKEKIFKYFACCVMTDDVTVNQTFSKANKWLLVYWLETLFCHCKPALYVTQFLHLSDFKNFFSACLVLGSTAEPASADHFSEGITTRLCKIILLSDWFIKKCQFSLVNKSNHSYHGNNSTKPVVIPSEKWSTDACSAVGIRAEKGEDGFLLCA